MEIEIRKKPKPRIGALLLAAGSSTRMGLAGPDKLLLPFEGQPLILHSVRALMGSGFVDEIIVVVRPGFKLPIAKDRITTKPIRFIENAGFQEGMGSSLRLGAGSLNPLMDAYVIMLGDMPRIDSRLVDRMINAWARSAKPIVAPVFMAKRGHPVVVSSSLRELLMASKNDQGLRSVLKEQKDLLEEIDADDGSCLFDVDRPSDFLKNARVLIKGAGEQASATAHRLFRCGFRVVMTEIEMPTAVRRKVSFCSAIHEKEIEVEGVRACGYNLSEIGEDGGFLDRRSLSHIPVVVDPGAKCIRIWKPDILIDARILKKNPDTKIDDASFVIAYGPGFVAGLDVHAVVETMRGHNLGRIVFEGSASPNTGVPGLVGGESIHRVLVSSAEGRLKNFCDIGGYVERGMEICSVDGKTICAQIGGVLRGLALDGLYVHKGQKIGDIDPRGEKDYCHTISDKARCISGAALELVLSNR